MTYIAPIIWFILLRYIQAQSNQEMIEQGRVQYQLLQERKNLPTYGSCWKSAIEHIEDGCQSLSEDVQSSMALHLANCFLEMSGHESYNCELEKKLNLRQICISSMTDRAFNVYTEFYTHTQNMCWFLRGQIWQETISENTYRVGKQLEESAKNQEDILRMQKESLDVQEKLLRHGRALEKVMEEFYLSTRLHQETLSVMSTSLKSLQSWLIGEISWVDLLMFYISTSILILILTSSKQTVAARLPLWILLVANGGVERLICTYIADYHHGEDIYTNISKYIWWSRKTFYVLALVTLIYFAYRYKDLNVVNNDLLQKICDQNLTILSKFDESKRAQSEISVVQEKSSSSNTPLKQQSPVLEENTPSATNNTETFYPNKVLSVRSLRYSLRSKSRSPWDKYC